MSQAVTAIIDTDENSVDVFTYETTEDRDVMFPELKNLKEEYPQIAFSKGIRLVNGTLELQSAQPGNYRLKSVTNFRKKVSQ